MKNEIVEMEEKLRIAMLESDVDTLDILISPDLIFTNHLGYLVSKNEDLESHRNQDFKFSELKLSDFHFNILHLNIIVSVRAEIEGLYKGQEANGNFRFTRVWSKGAGHWQVVAGHASLIL